MRLECETLDVGAGVLPDEAAKAIRDRGVHVLREYCRPSPVSSSCSSLLQTHRHLTLLTLFSRSAVNLNGWTAGNRNDIFQARAAPIQANYLGYPGTMASPYVQVQHHCLVFGIFAREGSLGGRVCDSLSQPLGPSSDRYVSDRYISERYIIDIYISDRYISDRYIGHGASLQRAGHGSCTTYIYELTTGLALCDFTS